MKKIEILFVALTIVLIAISSTKPAQALNGRSWVSGTGSGTDCTRTSPCADFQTAHDATIDGGEIACLDPGDFTFFTQLTITKSITIDCGGTLGVYEFHHIQINAAGKIVRLRNLSIEGLPGGDGVAINFVNGAALYMENCTIFGWQANDGSGNGILFSPPAGVTAKLVVTDSVIENNGTSSGGGIVIKPASTAVADVTIERTKVENNVYGFFATSANGGTIRGVVRDSVVSGNSAFGITALGSAAKLLIENTTVTRNQYGLVAENGASVLVSHSSMALNQQGLLTSGGGTLSSFKNNNLSGNTTGNGPFTATIAQQ